MNTDVLYGILGGGGGSGVLIALIAMFRGRSMDEADVADRFSGTMDSVLASAEAQVKRMDNDLHRMSEQLRKNQELIDEQARTIRELRDVTREMLGDLDYHQVDTHRYRDRLQAI